MKKLTLITLFLMGMLSIASAQKVRYYAYDETGNFRGWFEMDRSIKKYYFDTDSPSEAEAEMKNYKKNGNTETFDVVHHGQLVRNVKLVMNKDLSGGDMTETAFGNTEKFTIMKNNPSRLGNNNPVQGEAKPENAVDKAKNGAKNLLNKGKNLFKKKK